MDDLAIVFGRGEHSVGEDRFEIEAFAAEELDIPSYPLSLDRVVEGRFERAFRRLPAPDGRRWLYRGWMLGEDDYTALAEAFDERGEELVVSPEAFAEATYTPHYWPRLAEGTRHRLAETLWTEEIDVPLAWELAQRVGPGPWIVKDHVKSAKEAWHRAMFVPRGATFEDFAEVCAGLVEHRGEQFERGFVVKEYLELAVLPGFTEERRRVTDEHRLVFWEGALVAHAPYSDVDAELPDPASFAYLGARLDSPFFVVDVARLASGGYTILEVNDGGSAILPERLDPRDLYRAIRSWHGR